MKRDRLKRNLWSITLRAITAICSHQYTMVADTYSFGIIISKYMSIIKCWDAKVENRPTSKEIYQILKKLEDNFGKFYAQIKDVEKIRTNKLKNRSNENENNLKSTYPQVIYTTRLLNFKNISEPMNLTKLSLFQHKSGEFIIINILYKKIFYIKDIY